MVVICSCKFWMYMLDMYQIITRIVRFVRLYLVLSISHCDITKTNPELHDLPSWILFLDLVWWHLIDWLIFCWTSPILISRTRLQAISRVGIKLTLRWVNWGMLQESGKYWRGSGPIPPSCCLLWTDTAFFFKYNWHEIHHNSPFSEANRSYFPGFLRTFIYYYIGKLIQK